MDVPNDHLLAEMRSLALHREVARRVREYPGIALRARALRHVTPFSFVVPPRDRWRIWRETRAGRGATP